MKRSVTPVRFWSSPTLADFAGRGSRKGREARFPCGQVGVQRRALVHLAPFIAKLEEVRLFESVDEEVEEHSVLSN